MAAVVSGRQTASGEQRGQRVAAEHATNAAYGTHGAAGVHGPRPRPRPRARARAWARARKFRGVRGYLHSEAPSSGYSETLGEHDFEDEDEDDFSGFAALAPATDQTDHNALNNQFLGGDQIGIQRVLGL